MIPLSAILIVFILNIVVMYVFSPHVACRINIVGEVTGGDWFVFFDGIIVVNYNYIYYYIIYANSFIKAIMS